MTSKLGAFLDPVADKLMVSTALVLLVDYYPSNTADNNTKLQKAELTQFLIKLKYLVLSS
jgi:phosphatidylglycerophosphate synthase